MQRAQIIIGFLLITNFCSGQSKQVKLYLQQIAANKVLIEHIQKGYKVARTGLTFIGNVKQGEFDLHHQFFTALEEVNPVIKKLGRTSETLLLGFSTIRFIDQAQHTSNGNNGLTEAELKLLHQVFAKLKENTLFDVEELLKTITSYTYTMTDGERLQQIENIFNKLQKTYATTHQVINDTNILVQQRLNETEDIKTTRSLHGL